MHPFLHRLEKSRPRWRNTPPMEKEIGAQNRERIYFKAALLRVGDRLAEATARTVENNRAITDRGSGCCAKTTSAPVPV